VKRIEKAQFKKVRYLNWWHTFWNLASFSMQNYSDHCLLGKKVPTFFWYFI